MSRAPVLALRLRDPGGSDLEGMFVPVSLLRDHTSREILDHLKPRVSNGKIHISVTHESARVAFINLPPFAPAFVHDLPTAPLGRGLTLLEMDLGASIRVALTPPGSGPMPQLILKARSLDGPSYTRSTRSVSKDSMTVTGLLPGRLEVSIQASGTKREYLRKTVQVTAAQALVLSCDL